MVESLDLLCPRSLLTGPTAGAINFKIAIEQTTTVLLIQGRNSRVLRLHHDTQPLGLCLLQRAISREQKCRMSNGHWQTHAFALARSYFLFLVTDPLIHAKPSFSFPVNFSSTIQQKDDNVHSLPLIPYLFGPRKAYARAFSSQP